MPGKRAKERKAAKEREAERRRERDEAAERRRRLQRAQRASVSPGLLAENSDHLVVDGRFVRMIAVTEWPSSLPLGWADGFMSLSGVDAPVTLVLRRLGGGSLKAGLNRTANETDPWTAERASETYVDRIAREHERNMATEAAWMVVSSNARIYECYLYVKLSADSLEELDTATRNALEHIEGLQMSASALAMNQLPMFWAASPYLMHDPYLERRYNYSMPASTVARGLWNREDGLYDEAGFPLGTDSRGGRVQLDMLSKTPERPNLNVFVAGESGSGKSTLLKMLVVYYRTLGDCKVIINDVEGEYAWLAQRLGGVVVRLSAGSASLVSPFEPRNVAADSSDAAGTDVEVDEAVREAAQARVLSTHLPYISTYIEKYFALDRALCHEVLVLALERAYARHGIDARTTFAQYYARGGGFPGVGDVYEELGAIEASAPPRDADGAAVARRALRRAVEGSDAHLWERPAQGVPDAKVVCVDMQGLSADPAARSAQYHNILSWEWSQVRGRRYDSSSVVVVADECHVLADNKDALVTLKDMATRIRKYGGALVTSTQLVSSLLKEVRLDDETSRPGEAVVTNAAFRFFGTTTGDPDASDENNAKHVRGLLGATKETMDALQNARRGRFLLRVGVERGAWVNVEVPEWMGPLFGKGGGR